MFLEIVLAVLLGIAAGIITGLIPGVHINLISIILVSISSYFLGFTSPLTLAVFIISMAITHTFLDAIPSIFLGAPDSDMALGVLPGHRLLLKGKGYEAVKLTVIGSFLSLLFTLILIPIMIPIVPLFYTFIEPFIAYILILVVLFMILSSKGAKKLWSLFVFLISGVLGLIVLNWPNLDQPLFPMLSGLFGISTLLISLVQNSRIPKQKFTETIFVKTKNKVKAISAAVFSGSLTGIFPGLGAAQAAVISMQLVGNIGDYGFMIMIGGINTVNFVFSLVTLYTLEKARNGAIVAVMQIIESIDLTHLLVFLFIALLVGGIAAFLALKITRIFAKFVTRIDYKKLSIGVIAFISLLVIYFSGLMGFLVLITSTAIGMIAPLKGVKRSNAMGCLLLPVILFFIL